MVKVIINITKVIMNITKVIYITIIDGPSDLGPISDQIKKKQAFSCFT
jgi:hypothetical protein